MTIENAAAEQTATVRVVELGELDAHEKRGARLLGDNIELLRNVRVRIAVSVGHCELTVKDLFDLRENAVLTLDKDTREPVEVTLDGKVIARGTLVAVDDSFGVKITEIVAS